MPGTATGPGSWRDGGCNFYLVQIRLLVGVLVISNFITSHSTLSGLKPQKWLIIAYTNRSGIRDFCGSEIQDPLGQAVLVRVYHFVQDCRHLKAWLGLEGVLPTLLRVGSCFWTSPWCLLSVLIVQWLLFFRMSGLRDQASSCNSFYDLASETKHLRFCFILMALQLIPDTVWKDTIWGHGNQQARILTDSLAGWLQR